MINTNYAQHNHIKPWAIPRSMVAIASTGYAYGAKRGQIRKNSDHNNIVPLYDFGVGTYDFDLNKVSKMAEKAQDQAETDIIDYFS